ncbi:Cdc7p-Dbf4p kinase complex regulatory subunit, partial [Oleoguttula sp. CCFEE 5521]
MAAALILSPNTQTGMAARRQPLASVPNAVNSPFRNTQSINGKRTRAQAGHTEHGQPPAKKQALDVRGGNEENVDPRRTVVIPAHDKLSEQSLRRTSTAPTALDRKLAAARDRTPAPTQSQHTTAKAARPAPDNTESIRLWQKHYKRLFPTFVFYFDNIQEDVRVKLSRLVHHLGSREEKFFSKAVTHVVTTRAIPAELVTTSPDDDQV